MKMTNEDLREAVEYTSRRTGFAPVLIEKDYYCSLILKALYEEEKLAKHLIFKGGTLLAKGYFDFFRLSEDLDFAVDNEFCFDRSRRRQVADVIRSIIPPMLAALDLREVSPFRGFNESRQYNGVFGYNSVVGPTETIKFEVGFRGDLMCPTSPSGLATLLENPILERRIFESINAHVLSKEEAFAEKTRAALTRKQPAIRDFFDLAAIHASGFNFFKDSFIALVYQKLKADHTANIDLTSEKRNILHKQIVQELNPVLKTGQTFVIDEIWILAQKITKKLQEHGN